MTCPYCGNEMKEGTVQSASTLSWYPLGYSNPKFSRWSIGKNAVLLAKAGLFTDWAQAESFYCSVCNKIIIDLNQLRP
jgi:hypothetical protein